MQMLLPRLSPKPLWPPYYPPPLNITPYPTDALLSGWVGGAECLRGTQHANIFELTLGSTLLVPPFENPILRTFDS